MRKILLLGFVILLLAPACVSRRAVFPDTPPSFGGRIAIGGGARIHPTPAPAAQTPCVETGRVACDYAHCNGAGFDYVTIQCQGKVPEGRCVVSNSCAAGGD